MKERLLIGFNRYDVPWERVRRILLELGFERDAPSSNDAGPYHSVFMPADSPAAGRLRQWILAHGRSFSERLERTYTRTDLKKFELFTTGTGRESRGDGGLTRGGMVYGASFDLATGCSACGTGARQLTALELRLSDLPKSGDVFDTWGGHFVISERLANAMVVRNLRGLKLLPVQDYRTGETFPWYQLVPEIILPRSSARTIGLLRGGRPCLVCGRDSYATTVKVPTELHYDRSGLPSPVPDIAWTWECFGPSDIETPFRNSRIAQPWPIVSHRVVDLYHELKVTRAGFAPVFIDPQPADASLEHARRWESALTPTEHAWLSDQAAQAWKRISSRLSRLVLFGRLPDPAAAVHTVRLELQRRHLPQQRSSTQPPVDLARLLGIFYGEQLRRAYSWEWIQFHRIANGTRDSHLGIVSPDRSLILLPEPFMQWQIEREHDDDVTAEWLFHALNPTRLQHTMNDALPGGYAVLG